MTRVNFLARTGIFSSPSLYLTGCWATSAVSNAVRNESFVPGGYASIVVQTEDVEWMKG
jgi:hypothetical protein